MTKEGFKKKYHGKVIAIKFSAMLGNFNASQEMATKTNQLQNISRELGLRVVDLEEQARLMEMPERLFCLSIPDRATTTMELQTPISFEEFLEDFGHYAKAEEEKEFVRAKQLLDEFKIEYGSIEKKHKGYTATDTVDEGFIQGYTSNEASLWWHPLGRRVFFVRGEGAFELTDKVEPKEEAACLNS